MAAGIYIHIPFCDAKCPYCDFYSVRPEDGLRRAYLAALAREAGIFPKGRCDSVYFGGGTPSLLEPGEIYGVLSALSARFDVAADAEVTLECNPATASARKLRGFRDAGINRLSVGVQSTDDAILRGAGRRHSAAQALAALEDAAAAGFESVSADVMIGLPSESGAELERTVADVCSRGAAHVSAYMLKIMEGTPFAARVPDGVPDDDEAAGLYERCCAALDARGLEQYEISNFALGPRHESRHNKKYWDCGEWFGLGAAAHSCVDGERFSFARDARLFAERFASGAPEGGYALALNREGALDYEDYIMLRLRTAGGLSLAAMDERYRHRFGARELGFIDVLCKNALARFDGDTLALTRSGLLVSNSIIAGLI